MRKKNLFYLAIVLVVLLATVLTGCTNGRQSTSTLAIAPELGRYNEETARQSFAKQNDIALAVDSVSMYDIVIASDASEILLSAAAELQRCLNTLIGGSNQFVIKRDNESYASQYIALGNSAISTSIDTSSIKNDGFMIKTVGDDIYLLTLSNEDVFNAVYGLLEDKLECMFPTPSYDYIPRFTTIYLSKLDYVSNPNFEWRKVFQYEISQNNWYRKLRNNGAEGTNVEVNADWGTWCHNVFTFVNPDIYLAKHPEYYSIVDGEPQQLCLTNPDIYPIVEQKMSELIAASPDKKYWDFSLNDNYNHCNCDNCKDVLKKTGSMMGTMLPIINRLALRFKDKIISTLAYFYNEKPPVGIECEPNVNIVIAPIASGQLYSYKFSGSDSASRVNKLVANWSKIVDSILIWDYVVDFSHLLMPYPNFDVQMDNHAFYIENNVKGMFHQGSRESNDELASLRSYVLSKQMWDNSVDINVIIAKYLQVTYGKGAESIAKYLDDCNANMKRKATELDLYHSPQSHVNDYLSPKANDSYLASINDAIAAVDGDSVIVDRIELIKINVLYAIMNEGNWEYNRKLDAFNQFKTLVIKHDIKQPYEAASVTMDMYINELFPAELAKHKTNSLVAAILPPSVLMIVVIVLGGVAMLVRRNKRAIKQ